MVYAQNKLLSSVYEEWDGSNYKNTSANDYFYDSDNNLTKIIKYSWSGIEWNQSSTIIFEYNSSNKLIQETKIDKSKNYIEYDSDGKPSKIIYKYWDSDVNQWVDSEKYKYFYNGNKVVSVEFYDWEDSEYSLNEKMNISYNGNQLSKITLDIKDGNGNWLTEIVKATYGYTGNNIVSILGEYLDDGSWITNEEYTLEYDVNGNLKKELKSYEEKEYKTELFYHNSELMSSYAHPFKNKTGYDMFIRDNNYLENYFSVELSDVINNRIESYKYYTYDEDSSAFIEKSKTTFSYTDVISHEEVNKKFSIVNQPTIGSIKIFGLTKPTKMEIYNSIGAKVIHGVYQDKIDINSLSKGIYFLKINDSESYKFIKN
jgi:hypothetical protein